MNHKIEEDAANQIMRAVNSITLNEKELAKLLTNDHRTLQQNLMRVFAACLHEWSKAAEMESYDLRNAQTVLLARKIVKEFKDELYFAHI